MASGNLTYNHTTNISGPAEFLFQVPNRVTGGLFGLVILGSIFMVTFLSLQRFGVARSWTAASFVTLLASVFLAAFGAVDGKLVMATAVMLLAGLMISGNGDTV